MYGDWTNLIGNLNTWRRGGERAIHKPLLTLMILGRAQKGQSREIRYEDVHDRLDEGLRLLGPKRSTYHPEYPFWHLESDDFWFVRDRCDAERFPRRKGKDFPAGARVLLDGEAVGEVREEYWSQLVGNPELIKRLGLQLLNEFWPVAYHSAVADHCGLDLRPVQEGHHTNSRQAIIEAYDGACAVCSFKATLGRALVGSDVAYIHFLEHGGLDVASNGLVLCALHLAAFVWGAIGITSELTVQLSEQLDATRAAEQLVRFHGRTLALPSSELARPAPEHIAWHQENVFRAPAISEG